MKKIILIGSGHVAHHLGHAFCNAGHQIVQVISKSETNAKVLAQKLNADFETDIGKIKQADFAIIGVNDDAIAAVSNQIKNMPFAHTSGSVCLKNAGVFYPIQTFSKNIPLDLKKVPFCVSAKNKDFENTLFTVAHARCSDDYVGNLIGSNWGGDLLCNRKGTRYRNRSLRKRGRLRAHGQRK